MTFLVNFENISTVQSPSKLMDYAYIGRPVLSVGDVIRKDVVNEFLNRDYSNKMNISIELFKIEKIADDFLKLLN